MTACLRPALLALGVVVMCGSAAAQSLQPVPLSGSVSDIYVRNGRLPGATVTVTSHRSGVMVTLQTDADGTFQGLTLEPGTYTISVSKPGYGRLVASNFCVVPGKPARFDAGLGPDRGDVRGTRTAPSARTIVATPSSVPSVGSMTVTEVKEAMAFGRRSSKLRAPQLTERRGLIRRKTAVLFTPFWRVATAVQIAAASNREFTEQDIPAAYLQRAAWIVAYPAGHYENDGGAMDSPHYLAPVSGIVIRPKGAASGLGDIEPVWKIYLTTDCDIDALESVLGRQFTRPGIVAAFPADSIKAGNTIVFTYGKSATPRDSFGGISVKQEVRRITIRDGDVKKWK